MGSWRSIYNASDILHLKNDGVGAFADRNGAPSKLLVCMAIFVAPAAEQIRRATAASESTVLLEIDGESAGRLPLQVQVLPMAIRLKV
jgi:hypothetical protein